MGSNLAEMKPILGYCGEYIYPDSLLLGGSGRVVGTQALRVIAVTALITL